jgi:hypothetical protein
LKNTIVDNKQLTRDLIAKLPNWRYFFEILAKLGLKFGIAGKAHFKKSAVLLWRIHGIDCLKIGKS